MYYRLTGYLILVLHMVIFSCQPTSHREDQSTQLASPIDSLMQSLYAEGEFNGAILAADSNEVIYQAVWGNANIQQRDTLTPQSVFYLGSIAKQFTAMAIMLLRNEDKITYDASIRTYFPQLPAIYQPITVRNLLTHTSGIPDYYEAGIFAPGFTNQDVWDFIQQIDSLTFMPGSQYAYSNTAYVLLSMLVEQVSGETFSAYLQKRVFDPLSMSRTVIYDTTRPDIPLRVTGHTQDGTIDDYNAFTTGGGGIFSNIEDLYKWERALYTDIIIPYSILQEAYQPLELSDGSMSYYGFGWMIDEQNPQHVYHSGSLAGFRTYIGRNLTDHTTIIILSNYTNNVAEIYKEVQNLISNSKKQIPR